MAEFARRHRVDAVVPVDDRTTVAGAAIAERLGLRSSPLDAVAATRNKHRMREAFARAGVRSPRLTLLHLADDPEEAAARVAYPCVLKPTILAGSRGVIRADDPAAFVAAFRRIAAILESAGHGDAGGGADEVLVEDFVPGPEVALEGLLVAGELHVLALFDKPDPLDGPYFEETHLRDAVPAAGRDAGRDRRRDALGGPGARPHRGAGPRRAARERGRAVGDRDRRPHDRRASAPAPCASARG